MKKDELKDEFRNMFKFVNSYFSINVIILCIINLCSGTKRLSCINLLYLYIFFILLWVIFYKLWNIKLLNHLSYKAKLLVLCPFTMLLFYIIFGYYKCEIYEVIKSLIIYLLIYIAASCYNYRKYIEYMKSCKKIVNKIRETNEDDGDK